MLRKRVYQVLGVSAALAAGGILYSGLSGSASVDQAEPVEASMQEGTLVVNGEGNLSVEPDLAQLRLGVEATDTSADAAQSTVSERMNAVREALNEFEIPEDNIETASFGVHTDPAPEGGEDQFRARHILSIEYSNIERVGELLDSAAAAGANQIQQTRFTLEDQSEVEQQVLKQAVENTAPKAEAMASGAGKSSGAVLQISESGTQVNLPAGNYAREESTQDASGGGTSIEAGQVEITQRVDVVYELN